MTTVSARRHVRGMYGDYEVVGDAISKGGVGGIYRTTDPKWVYKEYHSPEKAPPDEHLTRLVGVGRDVLIRQGQPIGSQPESSINWPVDIVRRPDGQIIGCVLPAIPDRYFHPKYKSVNTLDFLVMRRSSPPAALYRMVVLLRLAEILNFVHSKGLVHGDVNAKNVAWTLSPEPAAYLIDCDGMVPQDPPPQTGVQAVYWTDPRVIDHEVPAHDHYSDWYCLALAFYRGLLLPVGGKLGKVGGKWAAPEQIPADLDPRIATLMRRGLTDPLEPGKRPQPAEWVQSLMQVYVVGGKYDDAALAKLDRVLHAPKPDPATPKPRAYEQLPKVAPPTQHPPFSPQRPPQPQQPPMFPRQPPPQPQRQQPPRQMFPPQPPAPPPYQQPPIQFHTPAPPYGYRPPGAIARWALEGGVRWYLPLALLTLFCFPGGAVIGILTLLQLAKVDPNHPGRTAAMVSAVIALTVGGVLLLSSLVSSAR
ncbi:hypothetical protein [Paractinoplanes lichenicola]|uniref:Serine/threonine protein kinase n=1 Tax=Paractinoplanes lichenicola TaxID=2802976 RepID=A0ABS1VU86_9ACTN|nr:hypothetical protein [Actinoplanes lichenicola]MBL7258021.1 hypothetical protein [Actinoplanes lichenicola]